MNFPLRGNVRYHCDYILDQTFSGPDSEATLPTLFSVSVERYPAEPYSWGQSRGYEYEVTASLVGASLGLLYLDRKQLIEGFGVDLIERIEQYAAETYRDREI